jgi:hypothetical protein
MLYGTILNSLGYPQPAITIFCDNACAVGIANDTVTPGRTKSMDMQFQWIRDRERQQQFEVTWIEGADNLTDFFTKALPAHVHRTHMPSLVVTPPVITTAYHARRARSVDTTTSTRFQLFLVRGCVDAILYVHTMVPYLHKLVHTYHIYIYLGHSMNINCRTIHHKYPF